MVDAPPRPSVFQRLTFLVLLAGLVFRSWALPFVRFTGDESHFWATARRIALFEYFPAFGPSLTGSGAKHPGPMFYYLMALPQRLGASPYFGSAFVMLLHLLAGGLLVVIASSLRGPRAGLVAASLFAFAPWDMLYGSSIWLSSVAPIFGMLILYGASRAKDSARWQGLFVFFVLTSPQFHMSAPVVWVAASVLLIARWPDSWSRPALIGAGLAAVLCYAPAIVGELGSGFQNSRAILTEGGGKLPWAEVWALPLKVFGYGILFSTSEIGYHFARGYWGGGFSEWTQYFSSPGVKAWASEHGFFWGTLIVGSVLVSIAAWVASVGGLVGQLRKTRSRLSELTPAAQWTLALLAGLVAASVLLVVSRKLFFPHYVNLLMPALLLPLVLSLDGWIDRLGESGRHLGAVLTALIALSMASSTVRYLLEIDRLNGLQATIEMSKVVSAETEPVALHFLHLNNSYAWHMLAQHLHHQPLELQDRAAIIYRVYNRRVHEGTIPADAQLYGGVVLQRSPASR